MPEVIIKYKKNKTLQVLKELAKYFDFVVFQGKRSTEPATNIKGVSIVPGDSSINVSELNEIFTNGKFNAKAIRTEAWQRKR